GLLRAFVDGETAAEDELNEHLSTCASCRGTLGELRLSAALASRAVGALDPPDLPSPATVEWERRRLERMRQPTQVAAEAARSVQRGWLARWRVGVLATAAAAAMVLVVGTSE